MKFSKNAKKKKKKKIEIKFSLAYKILNVQHEIQYGENIYWEIKKCARCSKKYCSGDIKQKISLFLENVLKTRSKNDGNGGPHY